MLHRTFMYHATTDWLTTATQLSQLTVALYSGIQMGTLESPALVQSLFSIYLGPDPVAPEAKSSIGQGLVQLLNE